MIYRVENDKGKGPYYGNWGGYAALNCQSARRHPRPIDNGWHGRSGSSEVFGFASEAQLKRWFTPEDLQHLESDGYHVVTYNVEPVWQDGKQCTFFRPQNSR